MHAKREKISCGTGLYFTEREPFPGYFGYLDSK